MKRKFLVVLLVLAIMLQMLSGCGLFGKEDAQDQLTCGELLDMICDAFGMYDYTNETPYIASVSASNPHFASVQKCAEWDIINTDAQDYDVDAKATRGELALALVNAAVLTDLDNTDEEKMAVAVSANLVPLNGNKVDKKATVSRDEADTAVQLAVSLWANKKFTQNIQEVSIQDGVSDFTETETRVEGGQIYVPVSAGQIQAGDAFVYNDTTMGWTAAKAASVEEENGYYIITESDEEFDLEDIVTDIDLQESYSPNLAGFPFIDGNGVVHMPSEMEPSNLSVTGDAPVAVHLRATSFDQPDVMQTAISSSRKYKATIEDVDVEVEVKSGSVKVSFKTVTNEDGKGNEISGLTGSLELSDINLTNEIDYKVLGGLKSLVSKINYMVEVKGGVSTKWREKICAPYNNGNGKFLTNLMRTNYIKDWRNISDKGASSIKGKQITIGSWPLVEGGLAQVKLELKLNFSITGEVTATLEMAGAKGIEYRNGNIRVIKEMSRDSDLQFKCKAELTAGPGITLKILNKWDVVGVSAKLGIGLETTATVHLVDSEHHLIETYEQGEDEDLALAGLEANKSTTMFGGPQVLVEAAKAQGVDKIKLPTGDVELTTDICLNVRGYWILKIDIDIMPFLSKLTNSEATRSFDLLPKDVANIFQFHVEDISLNLFSLMPASGTVVTECTKEYTPFEYLDDGKDTGVGAQDAERLDLDTYLLVFNDEDPQKLQVLSDSTEGTPAVIWTSDNLDVATVGQDGSVKPVGVGMTLVTVTLQSDPNVYVKCAVYVQGMNLNDSNWEFLPADMAVA